MLTHVVTILSSAQLEGVFRLSDNLERARHEGRMLVALVRRGVLLRRSRRPLTARQLLAGVPGAVVGVRLRGRRRRVR
jgi:hypothetical protein